MAAKARSRDADRRGACRVHQRQAELAFPRGAPRPSAQRLHLSAMSTTAMPAETCRGLAESMAEPRAEGVLALINARPSSPTAQAIDHWRCLLGNEQRAANATTPRADETISAPTPYLSISKPNSNGATAVVTRVGAPRSPNR